jgi:hypothetical protein
MGEPQSRFPGEGGGVPCEKAGGVQAAGRRTEHGLNQHASHIAHR